MEIREGLLGGIGRNKAHVEINVLAGMEYNNMH